MQFPVIVLCCIVRVDYAGDGSFTPKGLCWNRSEMRGTVVVVLVVMTSRCRNPRVLLMVALSRIYWRPGGVLASIVTHTHETVKCAQTRDQTCPTSTVALPSWQLSPRNLCARRVIAYVTATLRGETFLGEGHFAAIMSPSKLTIKSANSYVCSIKCVSESTELLPLRRPSF